MKNYEVSENILNLLDLLQDKIIREEEPLSFSSFEENMEILKEFFEPISQTIYLLGDEEAAVIKSLIPYLK